MPSRPTGKPESAADADPATARAVGDRREVDRREVDRREVDRLEVELLHARGQHLRWIVIGFIVGALCVYGLGTLGKVLGVGLLGWGAWNAWQFVQTLRFAAGTVVIDGDAVELPRGLCRGAPSTLTRGDVTSVYFLRRAVPWTRAAPVLVIEAKGHAYVYPRDWFGSESDQRRILDELTPS